MTEWMTPKTDWYGKRDISGNYTGDKFQITDFNRIQNNTKVLIEEFTNKFSTGTVLTDFRPNDGYRLMFNSGSAVTLINTWNPTYGDYFDIHNLEYMIVTVRNIFHCSEGIWRSISENTEYQINQNNDYYELGTGTISSGYKVNNERLPEDYLTDIRPIIGSDGLWVDPYYQEYMFNYVELNALERGMMELHELMTYKRQDKYRMFVWNFGIRKGF